jgi:hypothetical protein
VAPQILTFVSLSTTLAVVNVRPLPPVAKEAASDCVNGGKPLVDPGKVVRLSAWGHTVPSSDRSPRAERTLFLSPLEGALVMTHRLMWTI